MRHHRPRWAACASVAALLVLLPAARAATGQTLFNGKDLSGWHVVDGDAATWTVEKGEIVTRGPSTGGWLATDAEYGSFALHLQFQLSQVGNSGIMIRGLAPTSVFTEVQLVVPWNPPEDEMHCTGSLYGHVAVSHWPDETPLTWRTMDIICRGREIETRVDGELTCTANTADVPSLADASLVGRIALQSSHSGPDEWVRFRNIRIESYDSDPTWVAPLLASSDAKPLAEGLRCSRLAGAGLIPSALDMLLAETAQPRKIGEEALWRVLAAASEPGQEAKRAAAEATLLRCLVEKLDAPARVAIARGLGLVGSEASAEPLRRGLGDPWISRPCLWSLERIPAPAASQALLAAAHDTALLEPTRAAAIHALGARGDRSVVPALVGLLGDDSKALVTAAIDTLGVLGDPRAAEPLAGLMRARDESLRPAAVGAVLRLADAIAKSDPDLAKVLFDRALHAARTEGHINTAQAGLRRLEAGR
jgi:hypothetical protein